MNEPSPTRLFDYLAWFRLETYAEVRRAEELYGAEQGGELAKYYAEELARYVRSPRRELNRFVRTREYFMARRLVGRRGVRILDCGCGTGTEGILFSLLGAEVVGVDLKRLRLDLAAARRDRWSREAGRELRNEYLLENLFDLGFRDEFDYVWVKEAISHIHPLPEFYAFAFRALRPGGELLVTDPNLEEPRTRAKIDAVREGPLIKTFPHPRTGEPIPYADERLLSIPELAAGVREAGFRMGEVEIFLPGQSTAPQWLWRAVIRPLDRFLPLSRRLGNEFCAAAVKP